MSRNGAASEQSINKTHSLRVLIAFEGAADPSLFRILERAGYETHRTGSAAVDASIVPQEFDAIVVKFGLLSDSNRERLTRLRRYHRKSLLLIVTSAEEDQARITALELGADDYLIRPLDHAHSISRIRTLVKLKRNEQSQVVCFGDFELNRKYRSASRGGRIIKLTEREYELLSYLSASPHRIFDREELLERVFEADSSVQSNVVDVYIRYLRNKIECEGLPRLIHTVRGKGYVFGLRE